MLLGELFPEPFLSFQEQIAYAMCHPNFTKSVALVFWREPLSRRNKGCHTARWLGGTWSKSRCLRMTDGYPAAVVSPNVSWKIFAYEIWRQVLFGTTCAILSPDSIDYYFQNPSTRDRRTPFFVVAENKPQTFTKTISNCDIYDVLLVNVDCFSGSVF